MIAKLREIVEFLSTLPARGATRRQTRREASITFLSTLPARGATNPGVTGNTGVTGFLSTLPARGATFDIAYGKSQITISIHAPREGSDKSVQNFLRPPGYFYPRSPRGERLPQLNTGPYNLKFLSTLPARGATAKPSAPAAMCLNFYPRSPRGERLTNAGLEGDTTKYLSTLPARGATGLTLQARVVAIISIHAPREGSDRWGLLLWCLETHFYPRSPRGERRHDLADAALCIQFLSPLPARGATCRSAGCRWCGRFLSTLPARGATDTRWFHEYIYRNFYPRSPRGERLVWFLFCFCFVFISIHAPREGSDGKSTQDGTPSPISIHAPREGSDDASYSSRVTPPRISIHAPREGSDDAAGLYQAQHHPFLSTLPARGATAVDVACVCITRISIHAPREGSDLGLALSTAQSSEFLSTLPARGAT